MAFRDILSLRRTSFPIIDPKLARFEQKRILQGGRTWELEDSTYNDNSVTSIRD